MQFDFTSIMDRHGKDSVAVDKIPIPGAEVKEGFSRIPMWVADMNFPTAPTIVEEIIERAKHPAFGYFDMPDAYFDSIIRWQKERNGVEGLEKEHIGYENGVLGGVTAALQAFSAPGEAILVHSPIYVGFSGVLMNNGRRIVLSDLKRDEEGVWRMDFEDMDKKIKQNRIHTVIFCSPHNPTGRVWERWEIEKAMEVYAANDCIVLSDEIWSDIIMPGCTHICTQSVSEDAKARTIAYYAPSKTFSLAGLIGSYRVVYNERLRHRLQRESDQTHYNSQNVLSMAALLGAYTGGGAWVDEMCAVIDKNHRYACDFIRENFPGVKVMRPQGTYMLFLDCGDWCREHGVPIGELLARGVRAGVIWQNGESFFWPDSIRMNLALPLSLLREAMDRLKAHAFVSL